MIYMERTGMDGTSSILRTAWADTSPRSSTIRTNMRFLETDLEDEKTAISSASVALR